MATVHPVLEQTRNLLAAPLAGCSAEQVARHPAGDVTRWNARQVVEHLLASWQLTTAGIDDRLQKGRPLQSRPTLFQRSMQFTVCELGYFPKGRKAPDRVQPSRAVLDAADAGNITGTELVARIGVNLAAMDGMLRRIEPQSKGGCVLTHIVLGPLSVRRWRRFHRAHARHHTAQIQRAIRENERE